MTQTFNVYYDELFDACVQALYNLNIKIEIKNKEVGEIQASTNPSILSWGEEIIINFQKMDVALTRIHINSNANSQLFSWGKDSANEKDILTEIEKIVR